MPKLTRDFVVGSGARKSSPIEGSAGEDNAIADDETLISQLDQQYVPFAPFSEWADLSVPGRPLKEERAEIRSLAGDDEEKLKRAFQAVKTLAAVETGAIENLYDIGRGVTITAALQLTALQLALEKTETRARRLIDSQLAVYDEVLDFATKKAPLVESFVRALHKKLCEAQGTYEVEVGGAKEQRPIPLGEYKQTPNHVLLPSGAIHSYASVLETPGEMQRLFVEINSPLFETANPILQAAYTHHALSAIHPFSDGNGRVARAVASVFIYRASSVPLMILLDHRDEYFSALSEADLGQPERFVEFVSTRCTQVTALIKESLRIAGRPSSREVLERISRIYRTQGGYTHQEIDQAVSTLLKVAKKRGDENAALLSTDPNIRVSIGTMEYERKGMNPPDGYRSVVQAPLRGLLVTVETIAPAESINMMNLFPWAPKDAKRGDLVVVTDQRGEIVVSVPVEELSPRPTLMGEVAIGLGLEGVFSSLLDAAFVGGTHRLRHVGY